MGDEQSRMRAFRRQLHATDGPLFALVKVAASNVTMVLPSQDGVLLKHRFRITLLDGDK